MKKPGEEDKGSRETTEFQVKTTKRGLTLEVSYFPVVFSTYPKDLVILSKFTVNHTRSMLTEYT